MDTGTDLAEFVCAACGTRWRLSFELRRCEMPSGALLEYYRLDGAWVLPPYGPDGARPCPGCGRPAAGHLVARSLTAPASPHPGPEASHGEAEAPGEAP